MMSVRSMQLHNKSMCMCSLPTFWMEISLIRLFSLVRIQKGPHTRAVQRFGGWVLGGPEWLQLLMPPKWFEHFLFHTVFSSMESSPLLRGTTI